MLYHLDFPEESRSKSSSPARKTSTDHHGTSRKTSTGIASRGNNMSLDKLTGDSLLFFSYSAASGGSGLTPDSQLGEIAASEWSGLTPDSQLGEIAASGGSGLPKLLR